MPTTRKIYFIPICLSLLFSYPCINIALAQQPTASTSADVSYEYKVQLIAANNPDMKAYKTLESVGKLYEEKTETAGMTRVVLGYYDTREAAAKVLDQVKAKGFDKAFINKHPKPASVVPAASASSTAVEQEQPLPANQAYMIQLGVFEKSVDVSKLSGISAQGELFIENAANGMRKILLGRYSTKDQAQTALDNLKKNGYPDAFIKKVVVQSGESAPPATKPETHTTPTTPPPAEDLSKIRKGTTKKTAEVTPASTSETTATTAAAGAVVAPQATPSAPATTTLPTPTAPNEAALYKPQPAEAAPAAAPLTVPYGKSEPAAVGEAPSVSSVLIATSPTASTIPNSAIDFGLFDQLFTDETFEIFNVDVYDPAQENIKQMSVTAQMDKNEKLQGTPIPATQWYLFTANPEKNVQYYATGKFTIADGYQGYMVRMGNGSYNDKNEIRLYIYDKNKNKFIGNELLSGIIDGNALFRKTQTMITPLDNNNSFDLLVYYTEEYRKPSGEFDEKSDVTAKIWIEDHFIETRIENKAQVMERIGLKPSKQSEVQ